MKKVYLKFGVILYQILKPLIYLALNNSKRTRIAIVYKDQLLLVYSWLSDGKWGLPGGGIKRNEDQIKSLRREVKEETGINLKDQKIYEISKITKKDLIFKHFLIFFKTEYKLKPETNIINKYEIADLRWFKINDILNNKVKLEDNTLDFIKKF